MLPQSVKPASTNANQSDAARMTPRVRGYRYDRHPALVEIFEIWCSACMILRSPSLIAPTSFPQGELMLLNAVGAVLQIAPHLPNQVVDGIGVEGLELS
jgi:hypothetical protein